MENYSVNLFKSLLTEDSSVFSLSEVHEWLAERKAKVKVDISFKDINSLKDWNFDKDKGNLRHDSGNFFSIDGICVQTNWGIKEKWDQPIINQPEIGFLGFIGKNINGILHLLVQAKIEPGNVNVIQISPTLQATRSNFLQVHKGKKPQFLEFFNGELKNKILLDQLQSEQGARFLKKRNRNIIIEVHKSDLIKIPPDFVWLTIGQIKKLMCEPNVINMDSRSVLSCIPFNFGLLKSHNIVSKIYSKYDFYDYSDSEKFTFHKFKDIISWLTKLKFGYYLKIEKKPIGLLKDWMLIDGKFKREDDKYFSIIGVDVLIENREVLGWNQPMIKPSQEGIVAFILKNINGIIHFLVQGKLEAGNFDIIELAPTVQCLTGNYRNEQNEYIVPYIEFILHADLNNILFDVMQSEEGGRFFKEQNRNLIVIVDETFPTEVEDNYCWMTLQQLLKFIEFNNFVNMAARSLISSFIFSDNRSNE